MARKKSIDLGSILADKSNELHQKSADDAEASKSFAAMASVAAHDSDQAHLQAKAVDEALGILDAAGVTL